ncbi:ligand-gated channel protein [Marinomonas sp. SBI22]|uniref:TonB-dependent siderophore receptor n=1 Tax=unclassified Marinomonas TaxID=196814 RepID=UPI0007AF690C|nr:MULTISPECIES: TonB-dependent siderophore receptor [unclassified Marinomonas]KZM39810.1 ligand-gated channel protein [Marinomonas sp. SBI22]KZM41186.1 ligand-gated channel protein [Marinomonas sp. SBI8L]
MKTSARFTPTLIAFSVALASTQLSANDVQTDESDIYVMSPLVIKGQAYRNTATKTQLEFAETPQAISHITEEELDVRGTESVAEAVRYVSGINTELRGGAVTRLDLFNIRGFTNYQNYYDGLQLLFNDWNLQPQIDAIAIDQVEVFKGPTSTLYGAMPPGGMVNVIGKAPQAESAHSVEVSVGSDSKKEVEFESRGALSDTLNYSLVGLVRSKDGQAVTSEEERIVIAPSLDWKVSEDTLINFNMYYQKDPSMGVYSSLPSKGTVYSNINGPLDSDAYAGDANWEAFEKEVLLLGYKFDHRFNDTWSFLQNVRLMDASAYQENTYSTSLNADERTLNRRAYLTDEDSKGITLDNQFSGAFDIGEVEHNVLVGVDYFKLESDIKYEDAVAPSIDLYNPNHYQISAGSLNFSASGYTSDFDIEKEQTGVYLQDQMRIDQWVVIAGARYDDYHSQEQGVKYGSNTNTKVDQAQLTGRVGALYEMENGFSPFVSYAQSFEPVSGSDKNGKAYDTSTANQLELGVKYEGNGTQASLTTYQILKENVLTRDPAGTAYDKIQVGEVRSRGVELDLHKALSEQMDVRVAVTVQDVEVTKDNSGIQGNTPIWVPEQQVSTWLNYQLTEGTMQGAQVGAGVRYIGKMQLDAANSNTVPSATLVDLSMAYDLENTSASLAGASVRLSVSNALNETYYSCYDASNCWFGDERAFELSGRYEF